MMSLKKRIMSVLMAAAVAAGASAVSVSAATVSEKESNNSMSTATAVTLGNTMKGSLSADDTVDWYKFTISSSGRVNLNLSADMQYTYFSLYDEDGNKLDNGAVSWDSNIQRIVKAYSFDLTKGTYYVGISVNLSCYGDYELKTAFTSANETFTETKGGINNTKDTASVIKFDTQYNGQLAKTDKSDFYKITLPSTGLVKAEMTAYLYNVSMYIYDADGKQLAVNTPYANSSTGMSVNSYGWYLTKGSYYILFSSGYTGNYNFKLSFTSSNESFIETGDGTNNTMQDASHIDLAKKYYGCLCMDDKDFYRFDLSGNGNYNLKLAADVSPLKVNVLDSEGQTIFNKIFYRNSITNMISENISLDLSKGTYYIVFIRENNGGNYNFSIAAPDATITDASSLKVTNQSVISAEEINLGSSFTVTGAATGGSKCYQYAFFYKKTTDKAWTVKQNFSPNPSVSIKPAKAVKYNVCVKIRDEMGKEAKKYFTVNVSPKVVNTSTLSASSVKLGSSVSANCSATGGSTFYKYAFYYKKKADTKWVTLQGFKESSKITFKPDVAGDYDICVKVIDSRTSSTYAVKKYFTLKVTK